MTQDCTIRPFGREDLSAAERLIDATGLFPANLLAEMAEPGLSGESEEFWLVAGQVSGLAYVAPERMTEGTWNLLLLAVSPESQRLGLGRALVGAVCDRLRSTGARLLLVETSGLPEFAGARTFYTASGFRREARIRDYYRQGEDKVVFSMSLDR
jgi:ribosomal protein S18 acetylase RimI-like enzyme